MRKGPFQKRSQAESIRPSKEPREQKEQQEFGPGKEDYVVCPECHCLYYEKSWHPPLEQSLEQLKAEKRIQFQICPACRMIKDQVFEGQVIIKKIPERFEKEIKNLIDNFGTQAFELDPQDRIISVKDRNGEIEVLTTENQMGVRLAKMIDQSFGGKPKTSISRSENEDIVRVTVEF